ncbi:MAG TPA: hypothetical protein VMV24_00860 [Candidatus Dormibacteraeota bacterium]|nr:hypothetical protein [Candidatus Dormibacteraeota bacterium]
MRKFATYFSEVIKKRPFRQIIIFTAPVTILLFLLSIGFAYEGGQQFSELAKAFLHGQFNFLSSIGGLGEDPLLYHGKVFWGEGPLPAVFLIPFVALFNIFHLFFYQGYLKWLLILGVLFFIFKIARTLSYSKEDSIILALGFTLGSVFIGVASVSSSWLFAQVLTTFLLFWSLYEFYYKKRWWLIGTICSFVLLTRGTAVPIIIFYGLELWQTKVFETIFQKIKQFVKLVIPVGVAIILLGLYNFGRFHNPFNGGYNYQLLYPDSVESRSYGVFSLIHIPANFYAAFLSAPLTVLKDNTSWVLKFPYIKGNPYGMSMFFTSPYLIFLFTQKWSSYDKRARNLIIAILISCLAVLSFYGIGKNQLGYRYSLDFLPGLFLLFMIVYRKNHSSLSHGMRFLLLGSGVLNFYLLFSFI